MFKKLTSLFLLTTVVLGNSSSSVYANTTTKANNDVKTIVVSMNKTNLNYMNQISSLKEKLSNSGYIGLMNTRGDGGNDDKRAYATIGSGGRASVTSSNYIDFRNATKESNELYESTTTENPLGVNSLSINHILEYNSTNGQYGSTLGAIGKTLKDNKINVSVIGNADTGFEEDSFNRNIALMAMDNMGRIKSGNVDDINIADNSMPFGLRTDYNKLLSETKKYYDESDVLFVELGDTTRLDKYKQYLNNDSYTSMKNKIYKNIDSYLSEVFNLVDSNDIIYIVSPTQSNIDYQNKRRLSPVIKFEGDGKGILKSSTTRRDGIVANVDVGVDILNEYGLKSDVAVGKSFTTIKNDNNIDFLNNEYQKIVTTSTIRSNVVNFFVVLTVITWIASALLLLFKGVVPEKYRKASFIASKEFLKSGVVIPLAFLIAPISNAVTSFGVCSSIIISVVVLYAIAHLLFKKDDLKQIGFFALLMISIIAIDSVFGTYLMKNNIMSYDAIIGARYYGIGNEYEGVTIASIIVGLSIFIQGKKVPKWIIAVLLLLVLITSAHPVMGANVGGAISEFVAYFVFMLLLLNIKVDFKKLCIVGLGTVLVVVCFGVMDMVLGSESHLSLFINQILVNGPEAIIQTFGRKISMNIKLSKTSNWMKILTVGFAFSLALYFKYKNSIKDLISKNLIIFKGFVASLIGCIVTLLVNDSGIVSSATALLYVIVTLMILLINEYALDSKNK